MHQTQTTQEAADTHTQMQNAGQSLSAKQRQAYDIAMSGRSMFLTGKAGTGKTFIVKKIMTDLAATGRKVVAVAPTGIAATNIGGQTIHSMFSLPVGPVVEYENCNFVKTEKRTLLKQIDTIIIDEVSMLSPDILDGINWTLAKNGCGGLKKRQVIFVGDLKQLQPVVDDNKRSVLYQTYDGIEFTYARVYGSLEPETVELDEILRQSDPEFIENLNIVRDGGKSQYFRRFIGEDLKGIVLAPYKFTVAKYNNDGLNAQAGELFTFNAVITGNAKAADFALETEVKVKNGCQIMYLVNSKENPLVNGTLGTFVSHNGCHYIRVNDTDFALETVTITKNEYVYNPDKDKIELKEIGSIRQYPIKLAYALTIHKSQGLTFDEMTLDLTRPCFSKGQLYVGLSRVRSPDGLRIIYSQ
jgi:ATP-dependent exoDNAse (exonuclease V) alpha subunit